MKFILSLIGHFILFVLLTVLTQVGGVVWLLSRLMLRWWHWSYRWVVFPVLYLLVWTMLPFFASILGREPMPLWATENAAVQPQSFLMVLANRHYVDPKLKEEVLTVAQQLRVDNPDLILTYLDANFPFVDGFPLLPHRSHDDGEKLDLAFFYKRDGELTSRAPAFGGYGRMASAEDRELDQAQKCLNKGYWQYSLLEPLARPFLGSGYTLEPEATQAMVRAFARRKAIGKIFLEPHLKSRWRLNGYNKIRFHGCAAVRHDDHLHIQL